MSYKPILDEVEHLNGVSGRLEGLADRTLTPRNRPAAARRLHTFGHPSSCTLA